MSENSEMEAQLDALDNEWLDAIGNNYMRMFGKPWETRDGETREEGLQSNISALFQLIEDQKAAKDKAEAACAELRSALLRFRHVDGCFCEASFDNHPGAHPRHWIECDAAQHALSTDCGKPLLEKLKLAREALESIYNHASHPETERNFTSRLAANALAALKEEK